MPYVPSEKTEPPAEDRKILDPIAKEAAEAIAAVAKKYDYTGAFLGELNFFITRILNHLPRALVKTGESQSELKYVLQAGMFGVLIDVLLEYKIRVNPAYEIAQIIKSGDCYDTPYYNKPVEVVDESGKIVGHVYVNMKRSDKTVGQDVLEGVQIVLKSADEKEETKN